MKKGIASLVCIIIGLIIIIVSFFGPWYSTHMRYSYESYGGYGGFGSNYSSNTEYYQNFYLTKIEMQGTMMGQDMSQSFSYDYMKEQMESSSQSTNSGLYNIFGNTMYIVIGVLITSIIALIGIAGFTLNIGNYNTMRKIGLIFGIITFILAILSIGYFWMAWNNQMQESISNYSSYGGSYDTPDFTYGFWFNQSQAGNQMSMGPGFAWYIMIIGGFLSLISTILIIKKPKQNISDIKSNLETQSYISDTNQDNQ